MKKIIRNLEELGSLAEDFIRNLEKYPTQAMIVGLVGDLGSGKTAFVQQVAKVLGVKEILNSPTFVIQKRYSLKKNKNSFENLIHIDAYRLESGQELLWLGWEEMQTNPKNLILIEWPEKISDILEKGNKQIIFKFIDEKVREVEVSYGQDKK